MTEEIAVTVNRRDIRLEEWSETESHLSGTVVLRRGWLAELRGVLSSGEDVQLSRYGETAQGALADLEGAIHSEGWDIT